MPKHIVHARIFFCRIYTLHVECKNFLNFLTFFKQFWKLLKNKNSEIKNKRWENDVILTSIPSLFMMVASIFKIAVLMDLGGGNLVMPILIAFDLLWFNTIISLFLFISCCFYLPTTNKIFSIISKYLRIMWIWYSLHY